MLSCFYFRKQYFLTGFVNDQIINLFLITVTDAYSWDMGRRGRDHMVIGFTTTMLCLPITTKYVIKFCEWLETGWWFSPGTPVSSTDKTDHHDITEILLKEALSTINQRNKLIQTSSPPSLIYYYMCQTLPISCFSITFLQTLVYSGRVCNWKKTDM